MRTTSLMAALLVAAALAGCTGGTSNEGQIPTEAPETSTSASQSRSDARGRGDQGRGSDHSYNASLEVSPDNGTAPLNVTLAFGVTWRDNGRHTGQDPNGTAGSSGDRSATGSGRANRTGDPGEHELNRGQADNLTWTLEVRVNATANATAGNGTGAAGDSTGNSTGDSTSGNSTTGPSSTNGTSSSSTSTGPSTNGTGNQTGGTGNQTGNGTSGGRSGNATAHGTVVASFNGTWEDLPGNRTVTLNATGSYDAVFTVRFENGTEMARQRAILVRELPPGSPLGNETRVFEGSFVASAPLLCMGSEDFEWDLNATFSGRAAEVSHVNVTAEATGLNGLELTLVAPNETELASGEEEIHLAGPFEVGTYILRVESCVSADVEFTVTAVANYATPGGFA